MLCGACKTLPLFYRMKLSEQVICAIDDSEAGKFDAAFASGCYPPRLSATQFPSATDSQCSVRWGLPPHCSCALSGALARRFNAGEPRLVLKGREIGDTKQRQFNIGRKRSTKASALANADHLAPLQGASYD
jgi:hypothetical protein